MKKLVFFLTFFSLVVPPYYYGMRNISNKIPKASLLKKNFSLNGWRGAAAWNPVENYPQFGNNNNLNIPATPRINSIKIKNASVIKKDADNFDMQKNTAVQGDKKIVINFSDPKQSSEFAQKIISTWKRTKEGTLRYFYESIPLLRNRKKVPQKQSFAQSKFIHEEQNRTSYWKYLLGGAAAYLAKLFYNSAQQETSDSPKNIPFDYSLDGELARSMTPEDFVALLHKHGLTVADTVEYQVKKKEEELYKEVTQLEGLTEDDWRILQNLFNLKKEFLQGHYDADNITFKGDFDSQTIAMVKSVLQKADIPCQVTVVNSDTEEFPFSLMRCQAAVGTKVNIPFVADLEHAEFTSFGFINVQLYLSDNFLKSDDLSKLYALSHEATHLLNMHSIEHTFLYSFLQEKTSDENKIHDYMFAYTKIWEYQADILPLAIPEYAKAEKHFYSIFKGTTAPWYVRPEELFKLSSRAVDLHEAEAKLLKKNLARGKK